MFRRTVRSAAAGGDSVLRSPAGAAKLAGDRKGLDEAPVG
jgi:hypothetical protein